nr:RNA polymerase sporulation sigma factor SigK [Blautia hansenii]
MRYACVKTFLKPLTPEEERHYLQEYKQGSLEAKNILIERNLRLVAHIVKKYQGASEELDDLISIGTIGLIKAVQTFDSAKASKLSTYAARCIDNELLMLLRSRKKSNREVSLYEPIGTDKEGNEISLLDVIETEPVDVVKNYALKQDTTLLYRLLPEILSQREQEILKLRYGLYGEKELTQREIAKRLNISRSYVSRIEKNALLKLRSFFPSS